MQDPLPQNTEDVELRAHVEEALSATYELDHEIGRGGMGIVYRAKDRRLKRPVAIKLLPPELSFRRDVRSRFLREAETAAQLSHPNIVPIYSVDEIGNLVFFVMACIEGDNLAVRLRKRGPLPVEDVRRWMQEVSDALAYAHARGVVHRDIKPDNILLDGIDGRALVTDFGIARAAGEGTDASRLTATGVAIGTPAYMSPEQASGDRDVDARSDLYSLGIVAYQTLCGEPPFVGNSTPALLVKHLTEVPTPIAQRRSDVPADLDAIVMRLLEKDPQNRFQSAGALSQALATGVVEPMAQGMVTSPGRVGHGLSGTSFGGGTAPVAAGREPVRSVYQAPSYQSRTVSTAPVNAGVVPQGFAGVPAGFAASIQPGESEITAADWARFEDPRVVQFRRQFAVYLFVNTPMVLLTFFGRSDFLGITTLWTVYIAWKYAKLWADDFDWHDVLRQPRDRMFGEVIEDIGNTISATFSKKKREELRAQGKLSRLRGALSSRPFPRPIGGLPGAGVLPGGGVTSGPQVAADFGEYKHVVDGARRDREEISRLLLTIPPADRSMLPDIAGTSAELLQRLEAIALDLVRLESAGNPQLLANCEAEIMRLESEANPFDTVGSDARVRRLASLRRERRALADGVSRVGARKGQLESCRAALEKLRLDLVNLRTGGGSVSSVTEVAEKALRMARDVDIAVQAAVEVQGLTARQGS